MSIIGYFQNCRVDAIRRPIYKNANGNLFADTGDNIVHINLPRNVIPSKNPEEFWIALATTVHDYEKEFAKPNFPEYIFINDDWVKNNGIVRLSKKFI